MKALPTLDGGLRIDMEDAREWHFLKAIPTDATVGGLDLAARLGSLIHDPTTADDWREYVVPDLRATFQSELAQVNSSIESAFAQAQGNAGALWITPGDAYPWYSALNQARLALEEKFQFCASPEADPDSLPADSHAAWVRSKFYGAIQSLLLEFVMK